MIDSFEAFTGAMSYTVKCCMYNVFKIMVSTPFVLQPRTSEEALLIKAGPITILRRLISEIGDLHGQTNKLLG